MQKRFLEFFAGGGMAWAGLGSTRARLWANDVDEKKCASYVRNGVPTICCKRMGRS